MRLASKETPSARFLLPRFSWEATVYRMEDRNNRDPGILALSSITLSPQVETNHPDVGLTFSNCYCATFVLIIALCLGSSGLQWLKVSCSFSYFTCSCGLPGFPKTFLIIYNIMPLDTLWQTLLCLLSCQYALEFLFYI